ncbi:MAG: 50S ribosomal protein L9 [Actinobacteria bacterium]|nr:50S ribosomal protein L9 [Actinomycetota bacterium]
MKVILLTDVKGRGKEGDVIEVARGFAANYLLPRKMAVMATSGNLKQLEARMHNIHKREETKRNEAEGQAAQIAGKTLVIEVKAGDAGKLFGSVTAGMVADALSEQLGVDVDRKKLDLHGHIKSVGEHTIDVRIYQDVTAELLLSVVPAGGAPVVPTVAEIVAEADAEAAAQATEESAIEETADTTGLAVDEAAAEDAEGVAADATEDEE